MSGKYEFVTPGHLLAAADAQHVERLTAEADQLRARLEACEKEREYWRDMAHRNVLHADELRQQLSAAEQAREAVRELARARKVVDVAIKWRRTMDWGARRALGEMFTCEEELATAVDVLVGELLDEITAIGQEAPDE